MLKQSITYNDLDGNEITEEFYFHLSMDKLAKMFLEEGDGDLIGKIEGITSSGDGKKIIDLFEEFVKLSYGVRSENGKRFIQTEDVWLDFYQSDAYSKFFMKLVTDPNFATDFIKGLMPGDLQEQVAQYLATGDRAIQDVALPEPVEKDAKDMTHEELIEAYRQKLRG